MSDSSDVAAITVDGRALADGPVRRTELGAALTRIAQESGGPIRVEVHEPGGTIYADIIDPPLRAPAETAPLEQPERCDRQEVEVSCGGFLPGEPLHIALTIATETADATGHLIARLDAQQVNDGLGVMIVFGAVSGVTITQDRL